MQAGHRTKHSGQNVCEMVCYSNVLLCDFSVFSECHFLSFSNFPPVPSPIRPDVAGDGTQMTDAGIGRRRWPGTLQEG
ncbi:unnamed protein product, partial [Staurois parvus]